MDRQQGAGRLACSWSSRRHTVNAQISAQLQISAPSANSRIYGTTQRKRDELRDHNLPKPKLSKKRSVLVIKLRNSWKSISPSPGKTKGYCLSKKRIYKFSQCSKMSILLGWRPLINTKMDHFWIPQSLFQSESKCKVFIQISVFIHIKIRVNYHNNNFALRLALKETPRGTRKWHIEQPIAIPYSLVKFTFLYRMHTMH